jgi:hypothetical protein
MLGLHWQVPKELSHLCVPHRSQEQAENTQNINMITWKNRAPVVNKVK